VQKARKVFTLGKARGTSRNLEKYGGKVCGKGVTISSGAAFQGLRGEKKAWDYRGKMNRGGGGVQIRGSSNASPVSGQ